MTEPRLDSEVSCPLVYLRSFLERNKTNAFKNPTGPKKKKKNFRKEGKTIYFSVNQKGLH